jgi:hypothetical protein
MWMYGDNSTISGMHVSTSTNLLIAAVTFLYVLLTGALVTTSKETIEQSIEAIEQSKRAIEKSEEAIEQSKKEQQIRDIEKRLELFYIPAENIMKVADEYMKNPHDTVNFLKMDDYKPRGYENQSMSDEERAVISTVEKLKKIEQYRFLATKETCGLFTKYLYEEENNENRIALSESIENDVKEYVKRLYELKQVE